MIKTKSQLTYVRRAQLNRRTNMERTIKVFVYGTLRLGESNHYLLENADLLDSGSWTYGQIYDTGYGYPAMIQSDLHKVFGELYAVNEDELKSLDVLEDYVEGNQDNLYNRILQPIHTKKGIKEAYVYVICNDGLLKSYIHSGDWKKYRTSNG
jgi:gamma-glutamylcyclotransferase (GGCT)/AIG2-like uncharacterized protein YtfP